MKEVWKVAIIVVAAIGIVGGLVLTQTGGLPAATSFSITGQQPASIVAVKDANIRVTVQEKYTGATPDINGELVDTNGAVVVAETQVNDRGETLSTSGPIDFNGFLMLGNDAGVSGTDRGPEVYYKKVNANWVKTSNVNLGPYVVYNESTPTWTGYDISKVRI